MALIKPFVGYLPRPDLAHEICSPPYDVVNAKEARAIAEAKPNSFMRVIRSEVDLEPSGDPYAPKVYARARMNLNRMITGGQLEPAERDSFYIYQLQMGQHVQTGVVAAISMEEYAEGKIKKHELTRPDKENDRTTHILTTKANTGQIFLAFRSNDRINALLEEFTQPEPRIHFTAEDGVSHSLWVVNSTDEVHRLTTAFGAVPSLYIADGHHRTQASLRAWQEKKAEGAPADSPFAFAMATLFPSDQLNILAYNRVVTDLGDLRPRDVLQALETRFEIFETEDPVPQEKGTFGIYVGHQWRMIRAKALPEDLPAEKRLDVAILQDQFLGPVLGVTDPRTDPRLEFVGGIHGISGLEARVADNPNAMAIACYPTSMDELLAVADAGSIMPPKSTWFEPKLRSGLVVRVMES
ncbi:MAG: DUF1015 domain-containing protein [Deltaproteobacteria bacterium]|nr:DUF1015 domain-containing protein [Deltaproteobacteria bacterium]